MKQATLLGLAVGVVGVLGAALAGCDRESGPGQAPATATVTATTTGSPAASAPSSGGAALAVGSPPPDFTRTTQDGATVHLAALKGKPVVLYFYPKDETPGCTKEACAFRDAWDPLAKTGAVLVGVSADTTESHRAFA